MPTWFKPLTAVLLAVYLGLNLLSLGLHGRQQLKAPSRWIVAVTAPLQNLCTAAISGVHGVVSGYVVLVGTARKNRELRIETERLSGELGRMEELRLENERLRRHLDLGERMSFDLLTARRIARGPSSFERTIRIGLGARDGLRPFMAVVHPLGAVGQILYVFERASDVLLLTDSASAVDAFSQRTRAGGILRGVAPNELRFDFLSSRDDVKVGDVVVTSGLDGIFPKGIPVGTVFSVSPAGRGILREALVSPAVDFTKLEEVSVVTDSNVETRLP